MTENNPNDKPEPSTSQMWGGRFAQGPSAVMEAINASIGFDKRLFAQDIFGSIAHCRMLVNQNILSPEDGDAIVRGLKTIAEEIVAGQFPFKTELEDIHMNVEARLAELIGDAAGRLHTARSRNDQVATDFRLWVREAIDRIDQHAGDLQGVMIALAESHADTVMPGFTHLQSAQPVTFGHHMLAYVEMLGRDRGRLRDCRVRLNECPLGAAALAGTSFPIDRHRVAAELGFDRPAANSLDAVSDRDFAMEFLAALSITAVHLSRLSEEIIIWCSAPFGFVSLSDAWSTGSSIMPQKRNPDAAELIRARAGRVIGDLNALMIVMKGLPLAYSKDMQDDKEPVFEAADGIELALIAMRHMLDEMTVNSAPMEKLAGAGYSTATDLADWLVRELGMPFRRAHHVTGELVKKAEAKACDLEKLTIEEMRSVEPAITDAVYSVLGVANSVASRTSFGGTAPANVREAARLARARFLAGAEATGPA